VEEFSSDMLLPAMPESAAVQMENPASVVSSPIRTEDPAILNNVQTRELTRAARRGVELTTTDSQMEEVTASVMPPTSRVDIESVVLQADIMTSPVVRQTVEQSRLDAALVAQAAAELDIVSAELVRSQEHHEDLQFRLSELESRQTVHMAATSSEIDHMTYQLQLASEQKSDVDVSLSDLTLQLDEARGLSVELAKVVEELRAQASSELARTATAEAELAVATTRAANVDLIEMELRDANAKINTLTAQAEGQQAVASATLLAASRELEKVRTSTPRPAGH
jgi:hypothetical protein